MEIFVATLMLAILVEGTITHLFGESTEETPKPWLRWVALVFGIAAAIAYQIDVLAALGAPAVYPLIGWVATGLIIGRGSNYVNDFVAQMRT